jgi:hypothetical protein
MRLIGITGKAGSGKSLVASRLVTLANCEAIAFATPLKRMALDFLVTNYGYTRAGAALYLVHKSAKIPELGVTMRHLLQTLGTDWGRMLINPYIWTNITADKIAEKADWSDIVVDDVRFESEADIIRSFDGLIIHLVRDGCAIDSHASEAGIVIKQGDAVVVNNGSVVELMESVVAAIENFYFNSDRLLELCHTPSWRYVA